MRSLFLFIAIASSAGCLRSTNFQCANDGECGAGGQCESDRFCSFADSSCSGGRRYGDNSGPNSGECTSGGTGGEAGMEPTVNGEAGMEPIAAQCPGNYNTLPNSGTRMHRYRLLNQNRAWATHRDDCQAAGVTAGKMIFLAFPDGPQAAMELAALQTLAGDGAWVGVEDITGARKNSLGQALSTETNALINESGSPGDCFVINGTSLDDESCTNTHVAVCECVP